YKHQISNIADVETAYAEALTVKNVFNTPYVQEGMPKLGTWKEAKAAALEEAKVIATDKKNEDVKKADANSQNPEIIAFIV
ncbi:cytochrome-c oxidase, cbb3-type subunit II, partial [Aliarcobacter butzleri]